MKKKKIIGLTAMSLVLGSTIATADASAGVAARSETRMGISQEYFQAEKEAIENGDYAAWKSAVEKYGNAKILEIVNENNFAKYAEAFKLRESGDMDGSGEILEELGIKSPNKGKSGGEHGTPISKEVQEAIESAIKNSDYDAWKAAMAKLSNPSENADEVLTEDRFDIIVEAYKLKEDGNADDAMKLLRDNGIKGMFLRGRMDRDGDEVAGADPEALMETYKNKDYSAWKALMEERGGKILEIINADNFSRFAEAKVMQSEGKIEEAREIFRELGFPFQDRGQGMEKPMDSGSSSDAD